MRQKTPKYFAPRSTEDAPLEYPDEEETEVKSSRAKVGLWCHEIPEKNIVELVPLGFVCKYIYSRISLVFLDFINLPCFFTQLHSLVLRGPKISWVSKFLKVLLAIIGSGNWKKIRLNFKNLTNSSMYVDISTNAITIDYQIINFFLNLLHSHLS